MYLLEVFVLGHIAMADEDTALLLSGFSAQLCKVQIVKDGIGDILYLRNKTIFSVEFAQLMICNGIHHMTAVRAVSKIQQGGERDGAMVFGCFHLDQSFESGLFHVAQPLQPG